jgi:hypothetical protein
MLGIPFAWLLFCYKVGKEGQYVDKDGQKTLPTVFGRFYVMIKVLHYPFDHFNLPFNHF